MKQSQRGMEMVNQSRATRIFRRAMGIGLCVIGLTAAQATATWSPGEGTTIVRIEATTGQLSGAAEWLFTAIDTIDETWEWSLPVGEGQVPIVADDQLLGTVDLLELALATDPGVSLTFHVTAGSADTAFTITSTTVSFPAITHPWAFATAAITVTDNNSDGATLTGLFTGTKAYEARYNAAEIVWADLISPVSAAVDFSNTGQERQPALGRVVIPATVDSIVSEYKFNLTAYDSASGTSRFDVIVPEPATMGFLAFGGLLASCRRRLGRA